jgi:hypothetical protein
METYETWQWCLFLYLIIIITEDLLSHNIDSAFYSKKHSLLPHTDRGRMEFSGVICGDGD